jgi:hypothetical protein
MNYTLDQRRIDAYCRLMRFAAMIDRIVTDLDGAIASEFQPGYAEWRLSGAAWGVARTPQPGSTIRPIAGVSRLADQHRQLAVHTLLWRTLVTVQILRSD